MQLSESQSAADAFERQLRDVTADRDAKNDVIAELTSSKEELLKNLKLVQEQHESKMAALQENMATLRGETEETGKREKVLQKLVDEKEAQKLGKSKTSPLSTPIYVYRCFFLF